MPDNLDLNILFLPAAMRPMATRRGTFADSRNNCALSGVVATHEQFRAHTEQEQVLRRRDRVQARLRATAYDGEVARR